jgi:hypothetical protein
VLQRSGKAADHGVVLIIVLPPERGRAPTAKSANGRRPGK